MVYYILIRTEKVYHVYVISAYVNRTKSWFHNIWNGHDIFKIQTDQAPNNIA